MSNDESVAVIVNRIHELITEGYVDNDLEPLKCRYCDSTDLEDCNYSYLDGVLLQEYDCKCEKCGKLLGHWAFGCWEICFGG